jgi:hypothetical protein
MAIKIAQINLARSRAAMMEIERVVAIERIDILLIQEPYWLSDLTTSMGRMLCVPVDGEVWACDIVMSKDLHVVILKQYSCNKFLVLKVKKGTDEFIIVNSYFKYGDTIDMYLGKLETVCLKLKGKKIVFCADVNAKSSLWFSGTADERGALLEDSILALEMEVLNLESDVTTFENTRGMGSNIDITVASRNMMTQVMSWKIKDELFISDHRLIVTELEESGVSKRSCNLVRPGSFVVRKANWLMFDWLLVEGMDRFNEVNISLEEEVRMLERTIKVACHGSIPVASAGEKKVTWWTREIEEMRKAKCKLERGWKRCRQMYGTDDERTMVARCAYAKKTNEYTCEIRREKRRCWEKLIVEDMA